MTGDPTVLERDAIGEITFRHAQRAIDEGMQPSMVADFVAEAVVTDKFWILPDKAFKELAIARWSTIADELNPTRPEQWPGMAPFAAITDEVIAALTRPADRQASFGHRLSGPCRARRGTRTGCADRR